MTALRKPPITEASENEALSPAALICLSQRKRKAEVAPDLATRPAGKAPRPVTAGYQAGFSNSSGA